MTDTFVTQCPHCQTRFRVTGAQLAIAGGAVRCGACLLVFNAARQIEERHAQTTTHEPESGHAVDAVDTQADTTADSPAEPAATGMTGAIAPASLSGGADYRPPLQIFMPAAGILRPDELAAATQRPSAQAAEAAPQAAAQAPAAPVQPAQPQDWNDLQLDLDQLSAELARLDDDHRPPPPPLPPAARRAQRQPVPAAPAEPVAAPAAVQPVAAARTATAQAQAQETAAALPVASTDTPDASGDSVTVTPPVPPTGGKRQIEEPPLGAATEPDDDEDDLPSLGGAERDEPLISGLHAELDDAPDDAADAAPARPADLQQTLINLNAEPLQLEWQQKRRNPWRAFLWLLLCLLAAAGLVAQYLYFNFVPLARQPQWRPWFEQFCPQIGCTLPSRSDMTLLKSSNLTVRSHPNQASALLVDAIIYNQAEYPQPFPLLELRFEDMNGLVLAQRSFRPAEYLGGELAGASDMLPQTPIHIALEIVDPGTQATSYSLSFHPTE